ncbi:MAG TPA: 2-dehydro-3-deoxy-D-gluconate 5-dehydrogenase KduD [Terracidiphilus sp.]|nr:2-dehydro-3-deoxy-D-gluconate 5-dehydrogenase KduD [Terracidiphilus sp.]
MPEVLDLFQLDGKNALVTGASRGLGAGMALALAQAGANVALHGSRNVPDSVVQQVRSTGRKFAFTIGDLQDPQTAPRLIEETIAALGSIDILVNNAGMIRRAPAVEYPFNDWTSVLQTNLTSVFELCQSAAVHMLRQNSGKIINIASLLTFQGGVFVPAYAAAKGAVGQLTKALANEWSAAGINVNAIAPGYMATDNTQALRSDPVRSRQILERIPAGRWGLPEDLAGAVVFLASRASNYVHGHVLAVDGGWLAR